MKIKYLPAAAALTAALTIAAAASAQEQTPAPAPFQAPVQPPIQPSPQQPGDERDPIIRGSFDKMDVREMLQVLDQVCPQQILIGEGVSGRVSFNRGARPLRLSELLDRICLIANLSWAT